MAYLTGDRELDRKLKALGDKIAKKAMRAGITAGLSPLVKALRAAVNSAPVSAALKREARKTVGKRFKQARGENTVAKMTAKFGFGVGKQRTAGKARGKRPGVGISSQNIHWPVLGTRERKTKSGKNTGAMAAVLKGLTAKAMAQAGDAAREAARKKIAEIIRREAAKKG